MKTLKHASKEETNKMATFIKKWLNEVEGGIAWHKYYNLVTENDTKDFNKKLETCTYDTLLTAPFKTHDNDRFYWSRILKKYEARSK